MNDVTYNYTIVRTLIRSQLTPTYESACLIVHDHWRHKGAPAKRRMKSVACALTAARIVTGCNREERETEVLCHICQRKDFVRQRLDRKSPISRRKSGKWFACLDGLRRRVLLTAEIQQVREHSSSYD